MIYYIFIEKYIFSLNNKYIFIYLFVLVSLKYYNIFINNNILYII